MKDTYTYMNEIKDELNKFTYFKLNKKDATLIAKTNVNNYLIIRQLVEISEILHDKNIPYTVQENNDVKLHIN